MDFLLLFFLGICLNLNRSEVGDEMLKMKVGIVSVIEGANYGEILQEYALQTVLKRIGHEVLTVKPDPKHILDTNNFHVVIITSNLVWRGDLEGFENFTNNVLGFVPKNRKCKMVAYAASFGVSYWDFSPKNTAQFEMLANQFDAISVREDSGLILCRDYLGVKALHVLDATMLLTAQDYIQYLHNDNTPLSKGQLLVYFVWGVTEDKMAVVENVESNKNYTPLFVNARKTNSQFSVKQWLWVFCDTEFVVTDSYYGCVFSIIFNKPFIVYGHKLGWIASLTSLLRIFELQDQLILSSYELEKKNLNTVLDWGKVNERLTELRRRSKSFLFSALEFRRSRDEKKKRREF